MVKKLKKGRIKWVMLIVLISLTSALTLKINGLTLRLTDEEDTVVSTDNTCESNKKTCNKANLKTIYNPTITNEYDENTQQEIITVQINKTQATSKFYYIIARILDSGYTIIQEGNLTNENNKVDYAVSTKQKADLAVILALEEAPECAATTEFEIYPHANIAAAIDQYLKNLDTDAPVVGKIDDKKCRFALFATSLVQIDYVEDSDVENDSYKEGGLCYNFKTGNCSAFTGDTDSVKALCESYNPTKTLTIPSGYTSIENYYKAHLPYCYSPTVDVNYSDKTVATMISNAISSYIADTTENESVTIVSPADSEAVTNTTLPTLTCNKDKVSESFGNTLGKDALGNDLYEYQPGETKKYHYTETKEEITPNSTATPYVCTETCQEEITVEYGPPVAVKAGLCFEYRVKVKSEVKCSSVFEGTKPDPANYNYCTPTPICNNSTKFFHQAGPNEDFDACVNECDGGKYSQSCINKCYDIVYESNSNTLGLALNYNEKITATQLANSVVTTKKSLSNTNISQLMKAVANNEDCKYVKNGSNIEWKCTGTAEGWETYGRYYFKTAALAQETITDDVDVGTGEWRGRTWYYKGVNGFKRACKPSNSRACGSYCTQRCKWVGCKNAKYLNPSDASADYNADVTAYNNAKQNCKSSATCNTETATFTIKVENNSTVDTSGADGFKASITDKMWTDPNNIVLDTGQCYSETDSAKNKYMTEWRTPGTSIDNKTGAITYLKKDSSDGYTYKEGQFCTALDTPNVNENWWKWRVNKTLGAAPEPEKHNITAKTSEFGKYNWDIEVKCFYASYDKPDCDDGDCDKAISYRIRSVDNENLFPDPDATTTPSNPATAGRERGFNWKDDATDLRNLSYEITPGALMETIQTLGTEIYSTDTFLDYQFLLDTATLKKVANYKTKYTDFTRGYTEEKDSVIFYKSDLIRGATISGANKKLPLIGCNNITNYESSSCQTYDNDYTITLR